MKLYLYALTKNRDRKQAVIDVEERPGVYNSTDGIHFGPFHNFLPKSEIGTVFRQNHTGLRDTLYSVYLLEDDKVKAMSLLKNAAQEDLHKIERLLEEQQTAIDSICGPVDEIIDATEKQAMLM